RYLNWLPRTIRVLKLPPPLLHRLNLLVRSGEFRDWCGRFCKRMGLGQPITAVRYCRMPLKTPIQTSERSDGQHYRKNHENEAAPRETAHSPVRWRRVNPLVHVLGRDSTSILLCASINLS